MPNTLRTRNRWFSAVAMTCLTGFALSGCSRGSHSLSKSLSDNAAREAIEAERNVAERKQKESSGSPSKEAVAVQKRPEAPSRDRTKATLPDDSAVKTVAKSAPAKSKSPRTQPADSDLETADWAGDYLDRRVKTVSDNQEGVVETAEPLLAPARKPGAKELFDERDESGTVRMRKPTSPAQETASKTAANKPAPAPGKASFEGQGAHPWAEKAPSTDRPVVAQRPAMNQTPRDKAAAPSRETASASTKRSVKDDPLQAEARQVEAKARIHTLLIQSKSLLNKGEYRSAYRVAQLAQRIAESEDLFFVAGEEQPADLVRAVLMKVRAEESLGGKSNAMVSRTWEDEPAAAAMPVSQSKETDGASDATRSNLPQTWASDAWAADKWQTAERRRVAAATPPPKADNSPWGITTEQAQPQSQTRNKPGPTSRGVGFNSEFPHSKPEWRGAANEPLNLDHSSEKAPEVAVTALRDAHESGVVQVNLNSTLPPSFPAEKSPGAATHGLIPRPFPSRSPAPPSVLEDSGGQGSEPLAVAPDWRTQDLNDVATNRGPLLVAPLPPEEPLIPNSLALETDDSFATDIQEPSPSQPESKLWMILAAAAGAFAMLFVRRRPAAVVRSLPDAKS